MNAITYRNPFEYFKDLDRFMVGADDVWNRLSRHQNQNMTGFPPYNTRKVGDNSYVVEIAATGFSPENINITVEENKLVVKGSISQTDKEEGSTYLYKGIATRDFVRTFVLDDHLEVVGAEMNNGLLCIRVEREIPPEKMPKQIVVNGPVTSKPQLLNEG